MHRYTQILYYFLLNFLLFRFLVEFGCDVNAQDSDGWTPLHCAASCNNLSMVKFLVESGACLFAATLSDSETPAEKCEEDEEGFDGCSEYLYSKLFFFFLQFFYFLRKCKKKKRKTIFIFQFFFLQAFKKNWVYLIMVKFTLCLRMIHNNKMN